MMGRRRTAPFIIASHLRRVIIVVIIIAALATAPAAARVGELLPPLLHVAPHARNVRTQLDELSTRETRTRGRSERRRRVDEHGSR